MQKLKIALAIAAAALAMGAQAQTSYRQSGNTIYGSDGSSARSIGNSTYITTPRGNTSTCRKIGTTTYCD